MRKSSGVLQIVFCVLAMAAVAIAIIADKAEPHKYKSTPETYDAGYEDGWNSGWYACYDEYYDRSYEEGYEDGTQYWIDDPTDAGVYFEELAAHYAREKSGWVPEEAWMLINAYRNGTEWNPDGSPPSKKDYDNAVNSLIYFFDFFYSRMYE